MFTSDPEEKTSSVQLRKAPDEPECSEDQGLKGMRWSLKVQKDERSAITAPEQVVP